MAQGTEITRVRIEARGDSEQSVLRALSSLWDLYADTLGGVWEPEQGGAEVQTTQTGYWGRLTMRLVE